MFYGLFGLSVAFNPTVSQHEPHKTFLEGHKKTKPPASQLNHQVHKASMQAHKNTKGTAINTLKSSAKNRTAPKRYPKEPRLQSSTLQPIL